jgi:IS1 family transposase/transposase-like protein
LITTVIIERCHFCGSTDIVRNGQDYKGDQKFHCHNCQGYGTLNPQSKYSSEAKEQILRAYQERASMRGIKRIFGVVQRTLHRWLVEAEAALSKLVDTLVPVQADDVLELDELWSFVLKKSNQQWVWIALCRRTRQIVAYYVGDRSDESCRQLWARIPQPYKQCLTYSDFWGAYQRVLDTGQHQSVGKESGQTAHVERWNNTLRQRLARFVRQTLSFSKSERMHELVLKLFIHRYNLDILTTLS